MSTISVIIATRNRPALFADALGSVLRQTAPPAEIIVVDDGSEEKHRAEYARVLDAAGDRLRRYSLVARARGHGGAYSRNFAATHATSDYLCFLDDDDTWEDLRHLERVHAIVEGSEDVDLHMSNQIAVFRGEPKPGPIWIEDLIDILRKAGEHPDDHGAFTVSVDHLMRCSGFCHLNTLVIRRRLFEDVGGLDEGNRWEYDRDLFLRAVDRARVIKHSPEFVGRHNVPDPALTSNETTSLSELERRTLQIRVLDRALLTASHRQIRAYARRHKAYTLKKIAESLAKDGRHVEAAFFAREALGSGPTWKWAAYTICRIIRSIGRYQ